MLGMRMAQGMTFTDTTTAASQAVVNETMARTLWPGQPAIGRRLRVVYGGQGQWRTVVGVVADALTRGPTQASEPMLYLPGATFSSVLLVRTGGNASVIRMLSDVAT